MCKFQPAFQRGREAKGHNPIRRLINMDRNNRSSLLLFRRPKLLKPRLESELRPSRPLYDLKVLKGIVMNHFYEFSSKKSNFALQFFKTPANNCPSSRPLYSRFPPPLPRFRTLYPRIRTLYPRTPAPLSTPSLLQFFPYKTMVK